MNKRVAVLLLLLLPFWITTYLYAQTSTFYDASNVDSLYQFYSVRFYDDPAWGSSGSDTLRIIAEKSGSKIALGYSAHLAGMVYSNLALYDSALLCYQKALELHEEAGNSKGEGTAMLGLMAVYNETGKQPEALSVGDKLIVLAKQTGNDELLKKAYINISNIYSGQGYYTEALKTGLYALQLNDENKNRIHEFILLNNIGIIYSHLNDYEETKKFYFNALALLDSSDKYYLAYIYENIGGLYVDLAKYDSAKYYFSKSLPLRKELNINYEIGVSYMNLGDISQKQRLFSEAKDYYSQANDIFVNIGVTRMQASALYAIADIENLSGRRKKAIELGEKSLGLLKTSNDLAELKDVLLFLSQLYAEENNYRPAYEYLAKSKELGDSLFNADKSREIGRIEMKYEIEKKQEEERRAQLENARIEAEQEERRDTIQYSGITIFILLALVAGITFSRMHFSPKLTDGIMFISLMLLFEFILVVADPYVEGLTQNIPLYKLGLNFIIALLILSLHRLLENQINRKLLAHPESQTQRA